MTTARCPICPHPLSEHVQVDLFFGLSQVLGCRYCECDLMPEPFELVP